MADITVNFHDKNSADAAYLTKVAGVVAANTTLTIQRHQPVNALNAALTMTLPTGQPEGSELSVEKVDSSTNTVAITGNIRGSAGMTVTLYWQYESIGFKCDANGSWWPQFGHKTKSALDAAYAAKPSGTAAAGKYVDGGTNAWTALPASGSSAADATTTSNGLVRLAGDLAGTAAAPTVPGLALKANITSPGLQGSPTAPTPATAANDASIATTAYVRNALAVYSPAPSDASTSVKGIVQLAGDLTGTAASPALATTGVTAGSYGSASSVPVLTVDAKGRVTSVTTAAATLSGVAATPAILSASLTSDGGSSGNTSIASSNFTHVPLAYALNDSVSGFNASTGYYTIPTSGSYLVTARIRLVDAAPASLNFGIGIGTSSAADGATFTWQSLVSNPNRQSLIHTRVENYTAGQQIHLYAYASAATSYTGAWLSVARFDGTQPATGNPGLGCSIWKNNTQSVSSNTGTQITFDSVEYNDSTSLYTTGSNQITVNSAGLYLITMSGLSLPTSATNAGIYMMISGTNVQESAGYTAANTALRSSGSRLVKLSAGATIQLWSYFAVSAGNVQGSAPKDTSITISRVGAAFDATYAPLVSPALTGIPTAPTASNLTNTTQLATTAFVAANTGRLVGTNAQRTALSGAALFEGLLFYATDTRMEWLYTSSAWKMWNSDWISYAATWGGITMSSTGGFYRFVAGRVVLEQAALSSSASTTNISCSIPFAARAVTLRSGGPNANAGWWATGRGNWYNGSNDLDLILGFNASSSLRFGVTNYSAARPINILGAADAMGSSQEIRFLVEYDPA